MKLSPEQINRLYDFTRQHYVEYYDLQTELVDHLANAIEEQWQENPKLSFETALDIEFRRFGIFGFTDVVGQRRKALQKRYDKIVWSYFRAFFRAPQVILIFFGVVVMNFALKKLFIDDIVTGVIFGTMVLIFLLIPVFKYISKRINRKKEIKEEKKWMFKEIIYSYYEINSFFILPLQIASFHPDKTILFLENNWFRYGISIYLTIIILNVFIIKIIIPSKAQEYLKQTYLEYEFAK